MVSALFSPSPSARHPRGHNTQQIFQQLLYRKAFVSQPSFPERVVQPAASASSTSANRKKKKKRSSFSQLSLVIFLNLDATKKKHYVQKSRRLIAFLCAHARWKKMSIWRYKLWLPWKRCVILAWFSHTWVAQTCESVRQTTQIASALTKWAPLSIF